MRLIAAQVPTMARRAVAVPRVGLGTVNQTTDPTVAYAEVQMDDGDNPIAVLNAIGQPLGGGQRVAVLHYPPHGAIVLGRLQPLVALEQFWATSFDVASSDTVSTGNDQGWEIENPVSVGWHADGNDLVCDVPGQWAHVLTAGWETDGNGDHRAATVANDAGTHIINVSDQFNDPGGTPTVGYGLWSGSGPILHDYLEGDIIRASARQNNGGTDLAVTLKLHLRLIGPSDAGPLPETEVFTEDSTWTKPPGAGTSWSYATVIVIGGGGGGGGGAKRESDQVGGGGGGGPGGRDEVTIFHADLGATEAVIVGGGGGGAAAQTSNIDGLSGSPGDTSSFGAHASATGGAAGVGGEDASLSAAGGAGGAPGSPADSGGTGGDGGDGPSGAAPTAGATGGPSAGGGGGGDTGTAPEAQGGAGGDAPEGSATGGAASGLGADGNDGAPGSDELGERGGGGGGGTGSNVDTTTRGGNGGNGGIPGAGGGGGGGYRDSGSTAAGAGGDGVRGVVVVTYS